MATSPIRVSIISGAIAGHLLEKLIAQYEDYRPVAFEHSAESDHAGITYSLNRIPWTNQFRITGRVNIITTYHSRKYSEAMRVESKTRNHSKALISNTIELAQISKREVSYSIAKVRSKISDHRRIAKATSDLHDYCDRVRDKLRDERLMCAFHDYIDDIARHSSIPESFENMTISDVMAWTIHVDNFTRLHGLDVSSYYAATEVGKEEVKVDPVSRFSMPEVEK